MDDHGPTTVDQSGVGTFLNSAMIGLSLFSSERAIRHRASKTSAPSAPYTHSSGLSRLQSAKACANVYRY